ncbi:hypothetical protein [uncultured Roseobacter sp.]|uniref:hypothetical protein n=1 Tax=uncultured Roseobacter sp. TaxID=114847 RepID=UPI002617F2C3|nr:hypothetical protein [uncultured Roseobacter sp.]
MAEETPQVYSSDILTLVDLYSTTALQVQNALGGNSSSIAALGSILEEYNDRFESTKDIFKQISGDTISYLRNRDHESILEQYNFVRAQSAEWRAEVEGPIDKTLFPVMLDVGVGNIQVYTAIGLLGEYTQRFPSSDPLGLKKYNSDYAQLALDLDQSYNTATVKFASLMVERGISWGQQNVANWGSLDALEKEAFAVYFYNVGEEFVEGRRDAAILENGAYNVDIDNTDIAQEYIQNYSSILERMLPNNENLSGLRELIASGQLDDPTNHCFAAGVPIDMWPLDPEFAPDPTNPHKQYDQDAVRAKIWTKPIEQIEVGDIVVSFDENGKLVPGPVTRTFQNDSKILLDFHGTRVTPGHVYYRPDSKKSYKYETLIDVLRDDGVIQHQDGILIRAATNVPVGSPRDGFVRAITGTRRADGTVEQKDAGCIRLGTRVLVGSGKARKSWAVADLIEAGGGVVGEDELIHVGDGPGMPFHWEFGDTLPKPEDFVLACSGTTLEDIYKAAEWESQGPRLPAPMVLDRGPVQPLQGAELYVMPRNELLEVVHAPIVPAKPKRALNRK